MMSNIFKKRDVNKMSLADDILNAGKEFNYINKNNYPTDDINKNIPTTNTTNNIVNTNKNSEQSFLIIQRKEDNSSSTKRQTYYLSEDNIDNISRFSEDAGMGKSEFLNYLLDIVFDVLKIE